MFQGEKIRLTAIHEQDLPTISGWFEDTQFLQLFDAIPAVPRSERHFKKWVDQSEESNKSFRLAIRTLKKDELLGFVEIDGILWNQRNGWLAIAIGNHENRKQGYGKEAMRLALEFGFDELNLHRVQLTVFEYNHAAIQLYEQLGFRKEGTYREFIKRNGKYYDMNLYGMLENEWHEKR
jgi:RimJ/RimL family protein N-acetyltransferase